MTPFYFMKAYPRRAYLLGQTDRYIIKPFPSWQPSSSFLVLCEQPQSHIAAETIWIGLPFPTS